MVLVLIPCTHGARKGAVFFDRKKTPPVIGRGRKEVTTGRLSPVQGGVNQLLWVAV